MVFVSALVVWWVLQVWLLRNLLVQEWRWAEEGREILAQGDYVRFLAQKRFLEARERGSTAF